MTTRKQGELETEAHRQELARVARVVTLGELSASLAHELNQPLTAILSNAQAAEPSNIQELREILKDIAEDTIRAGLVIHRMRSLVRKETLAFASLDLGAVLDDVVRLAHSDADLRSCRVALEIPPRLPRVYGDRVQLQQVALNLLLNAFDAMKDLPAAERQVVVRAEADGVDRVKVAVRDRGPGLTEAELERIFEPFFTTKREGLGMGLSISRSIIEAHGGWLWPESDDDRGTTFYFTVPTA